MDVFEVVVVEDKLLIFIFQFENLVNFDFLVKVQNVVEGVGGCVIFVYLYLFCEGQLVCVENVDWVNFGKFRDVEILKVNFDQFEVSM